MIRIIYDLLCHFGSSCEASLLLLASPLSSFPHPGALEDTSPTPFGKDELTINIWVIVNSVRTQNMFESVKFLERA